MRSFLSLVNYSENLTAFDKVNLCIQESDHILLNLIIFLPFTIDKKIMEWSLVDALWIVNWYVLIFYGVCTFLFRTRVPNPALSAQASLSQSIISTSTITSGTDYSSTSSSNELYQIIGGSLGKNSMTFFQQLPNGSPFCDANTLEIVQNVLLSTQENINFIHEIFRQVNWYLN